MANRELFNESQRLITTTDVQSYIKQANEEFVKISGYTEQELLGSPHNIVRHEDMPKAAFKSLWDTVKSGKAWMGMVKNKCKNGNYYWVDAFVTPLTKGGKIEGYQSVRVAPDEEHVESANGIYTKINKGTKIQLKNPLSYQHKLIALYVVSVAAIFAGLLMGGALGVVIAVIGSLLGFAGIFLLGGSWNAVINMAHHIHDDEMARLVYTGRRDEIGSVQLAIKFLQSKITTILTRAEASANDLGDLSIKSSDAVEKTNIAITNQQAELSAISSAITQMSASITEVSSSTNSTSEAAVTAGENVTSGQAVINKSLAKTEDLAESISSVSEAISKQGQDSVAIGSVMDVINGIAEQTNLLALNAAIEAARAGEQGRGFAVVADEVRTLAQRTQESTVEIKAIVDRLQSGSTHSINAMKEAKQRVDECVGYNQDAGEAYKEISGAVSMIKDMTTQVANAIDEQKQVADEVNRNIINIQSQAEDTANASKTTSESSRSLRENIEDTKEMIRQFSA